MPCPKSILEAIQNLFKQIPHQENLFSEDGRLELESPTGERVYLCEDPRVEFRETGSINRSNSALGRKQSEIWT